MRCVLVGNYGVGNIGDEALCEFFLHAFPDIEWTLVSGKREAESGKCTVDSEMRTVVPRLPLGFRSLSSSWWRTISSIRHADAIVFGGGSLFTDIESVWACIIWRAYAVLASFFHVPVLLAFQGAGPWKTSLGRRLSRATYLQAAYVSVRDSESLARLQSFGLPTPPVLTFDPAFALFAAHTRKQEGRRLVIIPRTHSDEKFFDAVRKKLTENFSDVRILLMQPDANEKRVGEQLKELANRKAEIVELTSVVHFLEEVSGAAEVISQRYHGALAAFAMEIPVHIVPQADADKLAALHILTTQHLARETLLQRVKTGVDSLQLAIQGVSSL